MEHSSAMMRLFADNEDSPVSRDLSSAATWNMDELEAVLTPFRNMSTFTSGMSNSSVSKNNPSRVLLFDEDSGLGMDTDSIEDEFQLFNVTNFKEGGELKGSNDSPIDTRTFASPLLQRRQLSGFKKKLFAKKRAVDMSDSEDDLSPLFKKFRDNDSSLLKFALTNSPVQSTCTDPEVQSIIQAVDRLSTEENLVADGSRTYSFPTILGKHGDLKTISCDTMAEITSNQMVSEKDVMIVDCRYPYEFQGGHIKGAINLYTKEEIYKLLQLPVEDRPRVIVFHCEFSSERGPKMYRFLRSSDRDLNKDNYPNLHYPEIYLLEGGYKVFYENYKSLCDPIGYKPMLHKDHASDLRHCRIKSKSWTGGQKGSKPSRSRLSRSCISFSTEV